MYFDNAGVKLYYERTGSGAPLLLLHGWGGKAASFLPVTRDFSAARTVYAVDFLATATARSRRRPGR